MQMILMRLLILILINGLTACSSMFGNVVPQTGPTMEQIYDGMTANKLRTKALKVPKREQTQDQEPHAIEQNFHHLPNPELRMYVFPHLAGKDEVPIPGYYTVFSAYEHDHYALPNEIM